MADPVTDTYPTDAAASFSALAWIPGDLDPWLAAIDRALVVPGLERLMVALGPHQGLDLLPSDPRLEVVSAGSLSQTLAALPDLVDGPVLLMTAPTMLPEVGIGTSLDAMAADIRVAAVAFLSNAADHLSFPGRNSPTQYSLEGHDETTLTRLLRTAPLQLPPPIAAVSGGAVLVSRNCLVVTGGTDDALGGDPEAALIEMVMRAGRRGMRAMLDTRTYVSRLWEGNHWTKVPPMRDASVRGFIAHRHASAVALHDRENHVDDSPLALALDTARSTVRGLRILIDASCLGPIENGTQVQTLALIEALARRDDVQWVGAGIGGDVPRYAERVLAHPKVRVVLTKELRFTGRPEADIVHRPFQPVGRMPWGNWRRSGTRVVVTLQDLIAYGVGAYHDQPGLWMEYRDGVASSVARADGLVVISHDVEADLHRERLPLVEERTFVVENGTDHLAGDEPEQFPEELSARGWAARDFLVVLGANYSHKNRDLAIRTFKRLKADHPSLGLVLAGVAVAEGSSRRLETLELRDAADVVTLPDVSSEERNWLLRHASICLYPTSAEGFGLVPFEAARFDTPTAFTRFGPLAEVLDGVPVAAESWDPDELAECCRRLLADPQVAAEQVAATLKCGERYTWDETAARLVRAYRRLLSQPAR